MRLRSLVESLKAVQDPSIISVLEQCGIKTEVDLLFSGSAIELYQRLPPSTISYDAFCELQEEVAFLVSSNGVSGDVELQREEEMRNAMRHVETGVPDLDQLTGGLGHCEIVEISGRPGSGKTVRGI
jgi:RAD51-like protein 3